MTDTTGTIDLIAIEGSRLVPKGYLSEASLDM